MDGMESLGWGEVMAGIFGMGCGAMGSVGWDLLGWGGISGVGWAGICDMGWGEMGSIR